MSSIYVHIPFCKKRCTYCNFYSTVNAYSTDDYIEALEKEIETTTHFLKTKEIETLYYGGGTPSILTGRQINKIYTQLQRYYNLDKLKEFTLEVNPDDITPQYIEQILQTKVNRVSIGVQSLDDNILRFINRRHSAEAAKEAVKQLQEAGYSNISIDLIYGIPNQDQKSWEKTVEEAIALKVEHISAYNLTFEEGTKMNQYKNQAPSEEEQIEQYETLTTKLEEAGYDHYEISNYSKPGKRSAHNSVYWSGGEYLGIGAGAHSYNKEKRSWNTEIKKDPQTGKLYWEKEEEELTQQDKYNDTVITALRTKEGIDISRIDKKYKKHFEQTAQKLEKSGVIKKEGNNYKITKEGINISNYIMREFIEV